MDARKEADREKLARIGDWARAIQREVDKSVMHSTYASEDYIAEKAGKILKEVGA